MLVKIGAIVRQVALIALLAAFLEMLLPEKKMTSYIRLVLGLFVVVAILTPLVEGLRIGPELDVTAWDLRLEPVVTAAPLQRGQELAQANSEAALTIYRERLSGQIKALVSLVPEVDKAEVLVDVASEKERLGAIRRVAVTVTLKEPQSSLPPKVDRTGLKTGEETGTKAVSEDKTVEGRLPGVQQQEAPGEPSTRGPENGVRDEISRTAVHQLKTRIIAMITHFYGLDPARVEVLVGR